MPVITMARGEDVGDVVMVSARRERGDHGHGKVKQNNLLQSMRGLCFVIVIVFIN